jgi:FkbM family methyltransferase
MKSSSRAHQLADQAKDAALTDPEGAKAMLEEAAALLPARSKRARAEVLMQSFHRAASLAKLLGWKGALVLRDGRLLVEQDGALFHAEGDDRFFRSDGLSMAKPMRRRLKSRKLHVRTVFDLGANVGEVAISFAATFPKARVFAFEPAPENLVRMEANIALQPERLGNLIVVREAVSDRVGHIDVTVGAGRMNTVVSGAAPPRLDGRSGVETAQVPTDTLEGYCSRFGVDKIDFLKVDIEGGEPLLGASVRNMAGRIGSAFVEVSRYGPLDSYLELADAFAAGGLVMFDGVETRIGDPRAYLADRLEREPAVNVWFLPPRAVDPT